MPSDTSYKLILSTLEKNGWSQQRTNGSHHIFTGPGRPTISIPVHKGKVKDVYRRLVEKAIREQKAIEQSEDNA